MKNERISAEEIILAEEHVNEAGIAGYGMRSYGVMTACEGGECDGGSYDDGYNDSYIDDSECEVDTGSGSVPDEDIDDSECCGDGDDSSGGNTSGGSSSNSGSSSAGGNNTQTGNTKATAIELAIGETDRGYIADEDDEVWYKFTPTITEYYIISTEGSTDTVGCLYNGSGKMLKSNDDAGTGFNFKIRYKLTAGETYYIRVRSYNEDNTGYFNISIEIDTVLVESVDIDDTSGILNIGDSAYLNVTVLPSDAVNKSLTWESSNPEIISVDISGRLTAHAFGSAVITATAQDGSLACGSCTVYCDSYLYSLVNLFEFKKEVALLIRELYNKVDDIFAAETKMQKAWKCARLLGGIIYGNDNPDTFSEWKWEDVAGKVSSNEYDYFTNVLCYSEDEYSQIEDAIDENYGNSSKPDFAHMNISLAARLAYELNLDGFASNIGSVSSDENVSYLAGWLGDASITNSSGATTFGNDDYCADLDAENIYRLIMTDVSSVDAFNEYYSQIFSGVNRAEIFLGYISYEYVQEKVFYELIDVELLVLLTSAKVDGESEKVEYYQTLLYDEEYHWKIIKEKYPDTYNFLNSMKNGSPNIVDYL